jgi:1-deoxy-D-xylulose-5-phosphate reductoisomerase
MIKRVVVLGSTGSIGTQTLDVITQHPDRFRVVGLAAGSNSEKLIEQGRQYGVSDLALFDAGSSGIPGGMESILAMVRGEDVDLVVVAVAGVIGLLPTIEAIKHGKSIALASKEVLVAAGAVVMPLVAKYGVALTPIDSEHSAVFQCLQGVTPDQVSRLILTASGGPFRGETRSALSSITPAEALNHPTWRMGGKITIDSATLMNKGLELIEAHWLFGVPVDRIEVVVHPQSIVHSFVEMTDGSVLGQMGWPDMRLPILYALSHPDRPASGYRRWNPIETPQLTFEAPDNEVFPSINLAREAAKVGGTMPCALNAANEEAANAFLRGEVKFLDIAGIVERVMRDHRADEATLDTVMSVDNDARQQARALIQAIPA